MAPSPPLRHVLAEGLVSYGVVCEDLRISRYTLSRMVRNGTFTSVRIGKNRYIARAAVVGYLDRLRMQAEQTVA